MIDTNHDDQQQQQHDVISIEQSLVVIDRPPSSQSINTARTPNELTSNCCTNHMTKTSTRTTSDTTCKSEKNSIDINTNDNDKDENRGSFAVDNINDVTSLVDAATVNIDALITIKTNNNDNDDDTNTTNIDTKFIITREDNIKSLLKLLDDDDERQSVCCNTVTTTTTKMEPPIKLTVHHSTNVDVPLTANSTSCICTKEDLLLLRTVNNINGNQNNNSNKSQKIQTVQHVVRRRLYPEQSSSEFSFHDSMEFGDMIENGSNIQQDKMDAVHIETAKVIVTATIVDESTNDPNNEAEQDGITNDCQKQQNTKELKNKNDTAIRHRINKFRLNWITGAILVGIVLLIGGTVFVLVFVSRQTKDDPSATSSTTSSTTTPLNDEADSNSTLSSPSTYAAFQSKDDLIFAIDDYIDGWNVDAIEQRYGPIEEWDVSRITDFNDMFSIYRNEKTVYFQGDLRYWDTSLVTTMSSLFDGCSKNFTSDLSRWDTSKVTNMEYMFYNNTKFNSDLSKWNVSQVTNMIGFCLLCSTFDNYNQSLEKWDTSKVITMSDMFSSTDHFVGYGLNEWDVSSVTDMGYLFADAAAFNTSLSKWNLSNVITMKYMFSMTPSFDGISLEKWDTSHVVDMSSMFYNATGLHPSLNLSLWNITNVRYIDYMFCNTTTFQGIGLSDWNYRRHDLYFDAFVCDAQGINGSVAQTLHDMLDENITFC